MPRIPSPSTRATLAENVRAFRKYHGLSQEELADRCELHRTYIGSVEREERNVSLLNRQSNIRRACVSMRSQAIDF
ncbi:MAG: helix-turn-helix domain-containing protein [Zoogloeaceae bacterium]|nr:helix-turn-helix domain-containing protein [Zoogloeaceae bacterium]